MDVIDREGEYYRVASPALENPLDGTFSMRFGKRWIAAGSFPVTYLNADIATSRANARRLLAEGLSGQPFSAEDIEPSERPVLVSVDIPGDQYLDVVTRSGCVGNGLPATYPGDGTGNTVSWPVCQQVGQQAWDAELPGIACRSAAPHAPTDGEELAWFDRHEVTLEPKKTRAFEDWYGPIDW
ncbi:MAG: RES domain-containing protein [Acidimicrobiales bacterium]